MNTLRVLKEFLKKGEISPRRASPPNRAGSLPYEQPLKAKKKKNQVNLTFIIPRFIYKSLVSNSFVETFGN